MQPSVIERPTTSTRRAAVVSRHAATLRHVAQSLGVAGLNMRQALGPSFLPHTQRGEFDVLIIDLDIDPTVAPTKLLQRVSDACPETPLVALAGIDARHRLIRALASPAVRCVMPKLGGGQGTDAASGAHLAPDEQDLAVALKRLIGRSTIPLGPQPYLLGMSTVEERLIGSSEEKDEAMEALGRYAESVGLADEKLRRVEMCTDELLSNAIYNAPRDEEGHPRFGSLDRKTPVNLGAQAQVRLRYGCDGRVFGVSVADRFGMLGRDLVADHLARLLEPRGPAPRTRTPGAGLGLLMCWSSANQLVVHTSPGHFTEVTAIVHVAGSNRSIQARGSALCLPVD